MTTEEAIEIIEQHQKWRVGEDMPMIHPKKLTESLNVLLRVSKEVVRIEKAKLDERLVDVEYLIRIHTELSIDEAKDLLEFLKGTTIRYKECYGSGSIMYPKWLEFKRNQS